MQHEPHMSNNAQRTPAWARPKTTSITFSTIALAACIGCLAANGISFLIEYEWAAYKTSHTENNIATTDTQAQADHQAAEQQRLANLAAEQSAQTAKRIADIEAQAKKGQITTIYLCKSYSGNMFWTSDTCADHKGLIDRMVNVPADIPFNQQIALGEQARAQGEALAKPLTQIQETSTPQATVDCKLIASEISNLDSMARQPQSGQMQDWIAERKRALRDTQFRNRCR